MSRVPNLVLLFEAEQLAAQSRQARAHKLRHPFIARVGDDAQQFLDTSVIRRGSYGSR
jgi:hypothetical protein